MRTTWMMALVFGGLLAVSVPAFAEEAADKAEQKKEAAVQHYAAPEIADKQSALYQLKQAEGAIVGLIYQKEELGAGDMEKIHEHSYTLEAVVEYLRDVAQGSGAHIAAVDELDEQVQAVHYASENHDAAELKKIRVPLGAATQKVLDGFGQ